MNLTIINQAIGKLTNWIRSGFNTQQIQLRKLEDTKATMRIGNYLFTQADVDAALSIVPDQAAMFSEWYRFSHGNVNTFPASVPDTQSWTYNAATKKIQNSTNSFTVIGVVSKTKYDNYNLDIKLKSADGDDDAVGILLAWYKDPVTGKEHTLTALRSPGGIGMLYCIVYNFGQLDSRTIANGNASVTWGNGASGALSASAAGFVSNGPLVGWGAQATNYGTDGSIAFQAIRKGDIITVKTTQWPTPNVLDDATLLTIDLSQAADLQVFRGPSEYGLCSYSQASSTWDIRSFVNPKDVLYDFVNKKVYTNVLGVWTETSTININDVGNNVMTYNPTTRKMVFVESSNKWIVFEGVKFG